jgi:Spy/CpxP family protein refolding chaperone
MHLKKGGEDMMKRILLTVMLVLTTLFFGVYAAVAEMPHDMDMAAEGGSQTSYDDPGMPMSGGGMMNCGMMSPAGPAMMGRCMGGDMMGPMGMGMMARGMNPGCGMAGWWGMPGRCMGCGMTGGGMGYGMMGPMMMGHRSMMLGFMNLDLNDKQKEELFNIRDKNMKEMIRKRSDREIAMLELRELLGKEPVDMKAVEAKVKQLDSLRSDIFLAIIKAREEMKAKLTPAQLKQLRGMYRQGCGMMQEMPGMTGHEGMGDGNDSD